MASPVACWMLVTKQPCLREEIKRFALSWRKIYGNRWKRLAWGRAKMPAWDVYAQTEQDSRKIMTASRSQGKALQLSKPASARTKRASRTAVRILLIPPEQCLNIYSHPTKGRKDCYFSLQLHTPCHSPPRWCVTLKPPTEGKGSALWLAPLSCGTDARSTQMKCCKEAITAKQPRDSPLSFLECHRSPLPQSTVWSGLLQLKKKESKHTIAEKCYLWWTQRHCQTACISYAHTETVLCLCSQARKTTA